MGSGLSQISENWIKAEINAQVTAAGPKLFRIEGQDEVMELRADGFVHLDGPTYIRLGYDKLPIQQIKKDDPILKKGVLYPGGVPEEMH